MTGQAIGQSRRSGQAEHSATVVAVEGRTYLVDWAAAQFGYKEMPLVTEAMMRQEGGQAV